MLPKISKKILNWRNFAKSGHTDFVQEMSFCSVWTERFIIIMTMSAGGSLMSGKSASSPSSLPMRRRTSRKAAGASIWQNAQIIKCLFRCQTFKLEMTNNINNTTSNNNKSRDLIFWFKKRFERLDL